MVVVVVVVAVFDKFLAIEGTEDTVLEYKTAFGVGLIGKLKISLEHVLVGSVDIQVVGVGSGNDRNVGVKLEKGTIIFVGLDNNIITTIVNDKIAIEILADTTEESATTTFCLAEKVGYHGGGSGLPMAACYSNAFLAAGEFAKHLGAFLHADTAGLESLELASVGGNCRSIDHEIN